MRAAGWGRSFVAAAVAAHLRDVNPAENFPYGDQDVLRIVQRHRPGDPQLLQPLMHSAELSGLRAMPNRHLSRGMLSKRHSALTRLDVQ